MNRMYCYEAFFKLKSIYLSIVKKENHDHFDL